eukprot:TRINITY_DN14662_c0_g1_i1.p1 TRINITY_DN14662_c0_g1~~TRINITY_DN14662_c0_g1_i1.p1  ORF type:complete len:997 (-),score=162.50 TRINITY_DN14662_c0_g1_i1:271-3177(-)
MDSILKPRLAELLLNQACRNIAANARILQKKLTKIGGGQAFQDVFQQLDKAIASLHSALHSVKFLGCEEISEANSPVDCDTLEEGASGTNTEVGAFSDVPADELERLCDDRMACIRPVVFAQLQATVAPSSGDVHPSHLEIIRRNIAVHPRANTARTLVSQIAPADLRRFQRGQRKPSQVKLPCSEEPSQSSDSIFNRQFREALAAFQSVSGRGSPDEGESMLPDTSSVPFAYTGDWAACAISTLDRGSALQAEFFDIGGLTDSATQTVNDVADTATQTDAISVLEAVRDGGSEATQTDPQIDCCDPGVASGLASIADHVVRIQSEFRDLNRFLHACAFFPVPVDLLSVESRPTERNPATCVPFNADVRRHGSSLEESVAPELAHSPSDCEQGAQQGECTEVGFYTGSEGDDLQLSDAHVSCAHSSEDMFAASDDLHRSAAPAGFSVQFTSDCGMLLGGNPVPRNCVLNLADKQEEHIDHSGDQKKVLQDKKFEKSVDTAHKSSKKRGKKKGKQQPMDNDRTGLPSGKGIGPEFDGEASSAFSAMVQEPVTGKVATSPSGFPTSVVFSSHGQSELLDSAVSCSASGSTNHASVPCKNRYAALDHPKEEDDCNVTGDSLIVHQRSAPSATFGSAKRENPDCLDTINQEGECEVFLEARPQEAKGDSSPDGTEQVSFNFVDFPGVFNTQIDETTTSLGAPGAPSASTFAAAKVSDNEQMLCQSADGSSSRELPQPGMTADLVELLQRQDYPSHGVQNQNSQTCNNVPEPNFPCEPISEQECEHMFFSLEGLQETPQEAKTLGEGDGARPSEAEQSHVGSLGSSGFGTNKGAATAAPIEAPLISISKDRVSQNATVCNDVPKFTGQCDSDTAEQATPFPEERQATTGAERCSGKGSWHRRQGAKALTDAQVGAQMENMVERAAAILRARVPRRHADYRPLRRDLTEFVESLASFPEVQDIMQQVLTKINET